MHPSLGLKIRHTASYPTCETIRPHVLHVTPLCCTHVRLENSPHIRKRVENESHIDEIVDIAWAYKSLGYSPYCQLVLWWNFNFLYGIRAGCPTCETRRLHVLHITPLCCPCFTLENSPHLRGHVENESHIDGKRDLTWAYKSGTSTFFNSTIRHVVQSTIYDNLKSCIANISSSSMYWK
ncbi:hypothetical protein DVH24_016815 [Malus domestica]|uniref:Uncharacterized protein n=1 Tax=Malus domestica TaxID=3750 RepID=A0A498HYJ6_MALDO|nr:hypothetical protein DVH24_016815 [Malus domestica]